LGHILICLKNPQWARFYEGDFLISTLGELGKILNFVLLLSLGILIKILKSNFLLQIVFQRSCIIFPLRLHLLQIFLMWRVLFAFNWANNTCHIRSLVTNPHNSNWLTLFVSSWKWVLKIKWIFNTITLKDLVLICGFSNVRIVKRYIMFLYNSKVKIKTYILEVSKFSKFSYDKDNQRSS
jgi:hypothetical protein